LNVFANRWAAAAASIAAIANVIARVFTADRSRFRKLMPDASRHPSVRESFWVEYASGQIDWPVWLGNPTDWNCSEVGIPALLLVGKYYFRRNEESACQAKVLTRHGGTSCL
jgi:hypothetical protein